MLVPLLVYVSQAKMTMKKKKKLARKVLVKRKMW